MPFILCEGDITKLGFDVDIIVNAANRMLLPGGGVCGAVFSSAGAGLEAECGRLAPCETGNAVITGGYGLCKNIIHAVGPVWQGGEKGEELLLASVYRKALVLAREAGARSIAFPLISSGIYGYPFAAAYDTAKKVILDFVGNEDMTVYMVLMNAPRLLPAIKNADIERFLSRHRMPKENRPRKQAVFSAANIGEFKERQFGVSSARMLSRDKQGEKSLEELISTPAETFSQYLIRLIDRSGMTDVQVYKRANIDRKLFSKIRSDDNYRPSKKTVLSFAVALKLSLDDTRDLLGKAGYALSDSVKSDIVVEYFISRGIYDIWEINEALFDFGLPCLS